MENITNIEEEAQHELHVDMPPGTELMRDVGHIHFAKIGQRVLVPQPANDPNDPLNWSKNWKMILMTGQVLTALIHQIGGLSIAPQIPYYMKQFDRPLNDILQFTGIYIITTGASTLFWVPISTKYGRRPVLLASCLLGIFVALWRALAQSYESTLAAAAIHGIASGTAQTIPAAIVSDVMFLHERGVYMGLFAFSFFASMNIGPIIAGVMSQRYGWRSFWWLDFGLYIVLFVWTVFLIPETKWKRNINPTEGFIESSSEVVKEKGVADVEFIEDNTTANGELNETFSVTGEIVVRDDYLYKGKPSKSQYGILHNDKSVTRAHLLRPFWVPVKLCSYPIVVWAAFVYSGAASIFLVINLTQSLNFASAPYDFSSSSVGYTNFATLGGIFIGLLTAGPMSDWICSWSTKRNSGIREAEMRLPSLIPFAVCQLIGAVIIAVGYQQHWKWPIIVILGYGFVGIQTSSVTTISATYAVDSYKPVTGDIFVLCSLVKDFYAYGVSYWLPDWIEKVGPTTPIMVAYAVASVPIVLGVLLYFVGKPLRRLTRNSFIHDL